jgi:methylglyoxal synthase
MTNIVVIAHDAKKPELAKFISERLEWLRGVNIIATGRTAEFIESQGLPCKHMSPGQSGGYIQITQMLENGEVDIVVFLRDHKLVQKHHEDIRKLLEACNIFNIPLATNYASAELIILGLIKKEATQRMQRND